MIWWDEYKVEPGRWSRWQVGPLELFARADAGEWLFAWRNGDDPVDGTLATEVPCTAEPDRDHYNHARYVVAFEEAALGLSPRQSDRAFVVRPELPLHLPAGEEATLYVSIPVWVSLSLPGLRHSDLFEIPSFRSTDTWFGQSTLEGELCYGSRTYARPDLSAIGDEPHRAIVPLRISNAGVDSLPIEQLRVPMPALSLYQGADERLWTDTVSLVRKEGRTSAELRVVAESRAETARRTCIRPPRTPVEAGTVVRAFSRFLRFE